MGLEMVGAPGLSLRQAVPALISAITMFALRWTIKPQVVANAKSEAVAR